MEFNLISGSVVSYFCFVLFFRGNKVCHKKPSSAIFQGIYEALSVGDI